ncbi:AAA family ATPase [Rhodococcus sp. 852002-51564_SCH6189132-a]|uniref:AAA family ATPase n=1 Tax=Rhodococcus sp. 852002-51564_SCH6189132-a TaxID=1834103 RepID=UPI0009EE59E1|nr:AAA family ATPase [Rhodococcus sp. 852002-51564_SCH6189132-a]
MFDKRRAQKRFDDGVMALGYFVKGRRQRTDFAVARQCFHEALAIDPMMCDAWLGLATTGLVNEAVIENLMRTAHQSLFREQTRAGLRPGTLSGSFQAGRFASHRLSTGPEIWAAAAQARMDAGHFQDAFALLETMQPPSQLATYMMGALHYETRRWTDVLSVLGPVGEWADGYLRVGANVMVGVACAFLGLFEEADRRLRLAEKSDTPWLVAYAMYIRALIARESGDEPRARTLLERVYATRPNDAAYAEALHNPDHRLALTSAERISRRTDPWDPATEPSGSRISDDTDRSKRAEACSRARRALDAMVGLQSVKREIEKLTASTLLANAQSDHATDVVRPSARSRHLVFTGPPGVGKTVVARALAQMYYGLGILATDTVVEVAPNDFFAPGSGSPELLAREIFASAVDGVLFIDEAYSLYHDGWIGGDAAGGKVIDGLLATMENNRDRMVVIVAGYEDAMTTFLNRNEGLKSRFSRHIRFPSYSATELAEIANRMAGGVYGADLDPSAATEIERIAAVLCTANETSTKGSTRSLIDREGNARFIRNLLESAIEERDLRIVSTCTDLKALSAQQLARIEESDVDRAVRERFPHVMELVSD